MHLLFTNYPFNLIWLQTWSARLTFCQKRSLKLKLWVMNLFWNNWAKWLSGLQKINSPSYLLATDIILRLLIKAQCLTIQCSGGLCDQLLLALVLYLTRIEVLLLPLLDHSLQAFLQNVYTDILPFFERFVPIFCPNKPSFSVIYSF